MDEAQRLSPPADPVPSSAVKEEPGRPARASAEAAAVALSTDDNCNKVSSASSVTSSTNANPMVSASGNEGDTSDDDHKLPPAAYYKVGGRIRLPDKLMEYLNKNVLPDTLWWQPDGDGFAFNTDTIQGDFLDKHFRGTKLTSFIRSLNRW
jgi:HSF-type DNA-binding